MKDGGEQKKNDMPERTKAGGTQLCFQAYTRDLHSQIEFILFNGFTITKEDIPAQVDNQITGDGFLFGQSASEQGDQPGGYFQPFRLHVAKFC